MPAAIDAIRIPARSMRIRPGKRQVMRLGRGHLPRQYTASSKRPCPIPCPSLRAVRPLNPSSSRIQPDRRRSRKLTGLQIKKKNPRLRCHPRSSPKCLRLLDRGNRQPSTMVTELSEPEKHLARRRRSRSADKGKARPASSLSFASAGPTGRRLHDAGVKTGCDGKTNPMLFQRRGGRKRSSLLSASSSSRKSARPDIAMVKGSPVRVGVHPGPAPRSRQGGATIVAGRD